jgi:uroporphyrinogen-III synthase
MRVWVTRARPAADATADRLRALGHEAVVSPVLEVRTLPAEIDLTTVGALAFTSANGVRAFAGLVPDAPAGLHDRPAFAVGDATAEAARAAGFRQVQSAAGDVAALAELIAAHAATFQGVVLHLSNREPAADLTTLLRDRGVEAHTTAIYETVSVEPADALSDLSALDAALIHSPKAARHLAERLDPPRTRHLLFACISDAAAEPLRAAGHEKVLAAPFPDEASLLKLLEDR